MCSQAHDLPSCTPDNMLSLANISPSILPHSRTHAGAPSCPPWAVTALLSACPQAGAPPLQAAQLSSATAQALSSARIGFSSIAIFPAVVPLQGPELCARPGAASMGRRLTGAQTAEDVPQGEAVGQAWGEWRGPVMGGLQGLEDGALFAQAGAEGSARQLMQFVVQPTTQFNRTDYLVSHTVSKCTSGTCCTRTRAMPISYQALSPHTLQGVMRAPVARRPY